MARPAMTRLGRGDTLPPNATAAYRFRLTLSGNIAEADSVIGVMPATQVRVTARKNADYAERDDWRRLPGRRMGGALNGR